MPTTILDGETYPEALQRRYAEEVKAEERMNNDRELLELAAKAAGYNRTHHWNAERLLLEPPVVGLCIEGVSTNWNPLTNDGDALRLAVKLGMCIDCVFGANVVTCHVPNNKRLTNIGIDITDDDPYAATRRAIVRAAAEIGKDMKWQRN